MRNREPRFVYRSACCNAPVTKHITGEYPPAVRIPTEDNRQIAYNGLHGWTCACCGKQGIKVIRTFAPQGGKRGC